MVCSVCYGVGEQGHYLHMLLHSVFFISYPTTGFLYFEALLSHIRYRYLRLSCLFNAQILSRISGQVATTLSMYSL